MELLAFGNVTVAGALILLTVLVLCAIAGLGMVVGKFALSLDHKDAPDILKTNWLWDKLVSMFVTEVEGYVLVNSRGYYYDQEGGTFYPSMYSSSIMSKSYAEWLSTRKGGTIHPSGKKTKEGTWGSLLLLILPVIDLIILWGQWHFLSMALIVGTGGGLTAMRYLSAAVWSNAGKIKNLDDRVEKLEDK